MLYGFACIPPGTSLMVAVDDRADEAVLEDRKPYLGREAGQIVRPNGRRGEELGVRLGKVCVHCY